MPTKRKGFSLVELAVAAFILSIILGALFMALSTGDLSFTVNAAKLEIQSRIRIVMDWIIKDVRQAISWNIASDPNAPSTQHLKFNLWSWNTTTNTWDLSDDYIEYEYDAFSQKLIRRFYDSATAQTMTVEFNNITEAPFYTTYIGPGDPGNVLEADQLRNFRVLIVVLKGQKIVRNSIYAPFNLMSEVKIRNG